MEKLQDSEGFDTWDARIASGLYTIISGSGEFAHHIKLLESRAEKEGKMLKGRQLAWLIYQHFRVKEGDEAILEIKNLMAVQIDGDDDFLEGF